MNSCTSSSVISTHTSLAGRDGRIFVLEVNMIISTHTYLAGRDFFSDSFTAFLARFLLTRPSRDATTVGSFKVIVA